MLLFYLRLRGLSFLFKICFAGASWGTYVVCVWQLVGCFGCRFCLFVLLVCLFCVVYLVYDVCCLRAVGLVFLVGLCDCVLFGDFVCD